MSSTYFFDNKKNLLHAILMFNLVIIALPSSMSVKLSSRKSHLLYLLGIIIYFQNIRIKISSFWMMAISKPLAKPLVPLLLCNLVLLFVALLLPWQAGIGNRLLPLLFRSPSPGRKLLPPFANRQTILLCIMSKSSISSRKRLLISSVLMEAP